MAASTSQTACLPRSNSPFSAGTKAVPTPSNETNETQDPHNFVSFSVLCLHDFNSDDTGVLSFQKNEVLDIIRRDDSGWWAAIRQDVPDGPLVGWIPQAYVSVLSEETALKIRSKGKHSRKWEYDLENTCVREPLDGSSSCSTIVDDDSLFQVSSLQELCARRIQIPIPAIFISFQSQFNR